MSTNNAKSKTELQNRLGKRKMNEDSINDEMESLDKKTLSRVHSKSNNSDKRKRDQSESKSSNSKDADMNEEKLPSVHESEGEQDDVDDDDDDEYDDEDEEDEELEGFIAPEEEVQREIEMEQALYRKEHRVDKKKKKKRIEPQLDDEDIELIQENTGVDVQRKRRLQKNTEKQDSLNGDEDQALIKPDLSDNRQQLSLGAKRVLPLEEEEQEELIDTSTHPKQRQNIAHIKERQYYDQNMDSQIDPDRAATARHIFEDPHVLKEKVMQAQKQREQEKKADQKGNLEELFDGDEIDDQFATRHDKAIAEKDIPERLQLKLGEQFNIVNLNFINRRLKESYPNIDQDIANEVEWIYHRLIDDTKRDSLLHYEDQVKAKISKVIRYFRCEYMDIPYIVKYRKFEYMRDLCETDIWAIFNLDLEYGKFQQQLGQMKATLIKMSQMDVRLSEYVEQISQVKNQLQLANFSPLIKFYQSYYYEELQTLPEEKSKRLPYKQDNVQLLKKHKLDLLAKKIFLDPMLFTENIINNSLIHKPPFLNAQINEIAQPFFSEAYPELVTLLSGAIKFQAYQLGAQPYIRAQTKKHLYNIGTLTTQPTEQGKKDLDPFHPSYRVKRINNEPLLNFFNQENLQEIFLDIIQNEKSGLISVQITFDPDSINVYVQSLLERYMPQEYPENFKKIYNESIRILIMEILILELQKEIRDELKQSAEQCIIKKCQEQYRELLMTGPFSCEEFTKQLREDRDSTTFGKTRKNEEDVNSIIPDRPRCTVMGVILQQIDNNNQLVSVAIVDKYGELIAQKDLQHLMPPRKFNLQSNPGGTDEEDQRFKKAKLQHQEEVKEHELDKDKIKELILKHQVDLIVVGANKLAARQIKQVLSSVAEGLKDYGGVRNDFEESKRGSKKRQGEYGEEVRKEAFVIWGSLEIPKLFANSHQSQKMLKGCHPVLKQAVSMARFEQDPMNEILNLWSFVPSENQTLQLNLHPLQKQINQAKLSDALEEINIQCVNEVGVDLNLVIEHDHMQILLSFISCLGPRKAKQLIQDLKSRGTKIIRRSDLYNQNHMKKHIYLYSSGFLKIKVPTEEKMKDQTQVVDILDQTRIHPESYLFAHKVARDVIYVGQEVDMLHSQKAIMQVIMNPRKLKDLDLKQYSMELEKTDQQNMFVLVEYIIEELSAPFKDPREYRTPTKLNITNQNLFYMLIDESEKTFKKGMIVTATVSKVFDNMVLCKLDNGLDATIQKNDLEKTDEKLQNMIQPGHVITGRIHELKVQEENRFGVQLNCKKKDLETHENYVDQNVVPNEDWQNQAFQTDKKIQQQGRFLNRRIAHPKFKNIPSAKAILELQDKEVGEFIFRPSSKGENNLTLTWKFYTGNIVHIDIQEHDKPVGASIGSKLSISDEIFENLQEIIERYIMPCNRHVREACNNPKFMNCDTQEELEKCLKDEKAADSSRICYRMTILPQYPQHIVLGCIPKTTLQKEYIKVKPRGLYFHDKYHTPSQALINWFKGNFHTKDYMKQMKRQKSPRAKVPKFENFNAGENQRDSQFPREKDWGELGQEWKKSAANSVHSMNDDNDSHTPFAKSTFKNSDHGQSRWGANPGNTGNPGYSEYGQNNDNNDNNNNRSGGGRGDKTCYVCKEPGHISVDCPQRSQQQKSFGRGNRDGNRPPREETSYGRGQNRRPDQSHDQPNRYDEPQKMDIDESNNNGNWPNYQGNSQPAQNNETQGWNVDSNPSQGRGATDDIPMNADQTANGWGQKTPSRVEGSSSGTQWEADNNNNTKWGASGNDNFNQDDRRDSPARSQRSQDDGGRGRGRGRGTSFGRGRGGGGNSGECFKCQQTGHMARDCPNPDTRNQGGRGRGGPGGGRGGSRACFKCNEEGHMARECPNQQDSRDGDRGRGRGRGGRECHRCKQEGHFARECPNDQQDGERPYKRQRRDDGGSARRDDDQDWNRNDNNNHDNNGGGGWNSNSQNNNDNNQNAGGSNWGN